MCTDFRVWVPTARAPAAASSLGLGRKLGPRHESALCACRVPIMPNHRHVVNPFLSTPAASLPAPANLLGQASALLPMLTECATKHAVLRSTGSWSHSDYSVYTGLGGIAFAFLRLGLSTKQPEALTKARDIAAYCAAKDPDSEMVSFYCGTPGALAILAVASHLLGEDAERARACAALLRYQDAAVRHQADELLFGRAGYLYCLLFVRQHVGADAAVFDPSAAITKVAEQIMLSGLHEPQAAAHRSQAWPLMWYCFDEPYLGAAHGHIGILAMLFHAKSLGALKPQALQYIDATLDALLAARLPHGNLPTVLGRRGGCTGAGGTADDEGLVHWCHGAPGFVSLLAVAACEPSISAERRRMLVDAAVAAGEIVWVRGLLKKGTGLCHGVAGNAYALLTLHRMTGDVLWLQRAKAFGSMLGSPELHAAMAAAPDRQRRVQGVPDSPCSLMEGNAGCFCFLLDLAAADEGEQGAAVAGFPGWELACTVSA